jgi:hypothetical protein
MPSEFVKIACSIGKRIGEGLTSSSEPLPQKLADLVERLEKAAPEHTDQEASEKIESDAKHTR